MAQKLTVVYSIEDALNALATYIEPVRKFNSLGAYEKPLQSRRQVVLKYKDESNKEQELSFVREDRENAIVRLHLPWQVMLFERLKPKYGELEHGSLKRQHASYHSDEGRAYNERVLKPFWVFTGDVGIKSKSSHEFGRIVDVYPINNKPGFLFVGDESVSQNSLSQDYVIRADKSTVVLPSLEGSSDALGNAKGKIYWGGIYPDSQGTSAVRCNWNSDESIYRQQGLNANKFQRLCK